MLDAVIIDFDDTIVQTSRFRKGLLEKTLREWSGAKVDANIALDWGEPFRRMVGSLIGINELEGFIKYYLCAMARNPVKPCIGAEKFLRTLQQQQIPVVILSSSISELIQFDLETLKFSNTVEKIFDSEMVDASKPNPIALRTPLEWLKKTYSVQSSNCIYIGDSLADMECAGDQIDFYAVLSGSNTRQDFLNCGMVADRVVADLEELNLIFTSTAD